MAEQHILDRIAAATRRRLAEEMAAVPPAQLWRAARQQVEATGDAGRRAFEAALARPGVSFICEVKKASPSAGVIAHDFPYLRIADDYAAAGAAALSVLTEPDFFQGDPRYLSEIAAKVPLPALRKDFVVDPYQLYQSRLLGASAVLLIVALLGDRLADYVLIADALGLAALVEVHDEAETELATAAGARVIGVNHRDLRTFTVDLGLSERLRPLIPEDVVLVAESGITTPADVQRLRQIGVDAVLVGETLMKAADKAARLGELAGGSR